MIDPFDPTSTRKEEEGAKVVFMMVFFILLIRILRLGLRLHESLPRVTDYEGVLFGSTKKSLYSIFRFQDGMLHFR